MKTVKVWNYEMDPGGDADADSVDVHEVTSEEWRALGPDRPIDDGMIVFYADLPDGRPAVSSCEVARYEDGHARPARLAVAALVFNTRRGEPETIEGPIEGPMTRLDAAEQHWLGREFALAGDSLHETMLAVAVPSPSSDYNAIQRPIRTNHVALVEPHQLREGLDPEIYRVRFEQAMTPAPFGGPAILVEMGEADEQDVKDRILRNVKFSVTMAGAIVDDDTIPLRCECPWCGQHMGGGEFFDGSETNCGACGNRIVAVAYQGGLDGSPGFMAFSRVGGGIVKRPADRKATRKRWRRQGRRG